MRVCYFGTYRATYSRNVIMVEGLRRAGVEVIECQVPLWRGIEDRVAATKGGWARPAFWGRVIRVYFQLLAKYRKIKDYDVLVVGYPGQVDVFLAWVLAWWRGKPLVWDVFMSIYLIALERGLEKKSWLTVEILRRMEGVALRLPDVLVQDTEEYVAWLAKTYGIAPERFGLVPTGADDRVFQGSVHDGPLDGIFRVVYYGTFIPNHGVEKIVEAARLLIHIPAIRFELIGEGPERAWVEDKVREWELTNVKFETWLEKPDLVRRVGQADVCLGAFGETPQSLMTVQNKIFEGLAMGKPVLTGDSPAVRRTFSHGEEVYMCERSGAGIATGVQVLWEQADLRERLAKEGYRCFQAQFNLEQIGAQFAEILEEARTR